MWVSQAGKSFEGRNGVRVLGCEILGEGCGVTLQVGRQLSVQVAGDLMHSFSLPCHAGCGQVVL